MSKTTKLVYRMSVTRAINDLNTLIGFLNSEADSDIVMATDYIKNALTCLGAANEALQEEEENK